MQGIKQVSSISSLKRVLGFPSLFIIAIGSVASQSSVVSIFEGAGLGGGSFLIALFLAFLLTLCYICTYSELSLLMPKAGSISNYTTASIGHFPAIVAAVAGNLAPAVFGVPADLILSQHVLDKISPGTFPHFSYSLVIGLTILNILGVNLFASLANTITYTMLVSVFVIGIAGLTSASGNGAGYAQIRNEIFHTDSSVLSLVVLAFWAFMSIELVCSLIEETRQPKKNIPKSMFAASVALLVMFILISLSALRILPKEILVGTDIPHLALGEAIFGNSGKIIVAIVAITTTSGVTNASIAAASRMFYGMAELQQLPAQFMQVNQKLKTPVFSILIVSVLTLVPLIIFEHHPNGLLVLISSAVTCWLVAYIIAHFDLIVLRNKYPEMQRPFKSPIYPIPQLFGIAGMVYIIFNNSPSPDLTVKVFLNAAVFCGATGIFAFIWVKYKMKKRLFQPETIPFVTNDL